jgi:protein tyrosine phosphatase (PTP) superfamily phosphohydrolase (DUF442 family)
MFSFLLVSTLLTLSPQQLQPAAVTRSLAGPATRLDLSGVDNAFQVNASLFRGAQPSAAGLAELAKLGVTIVVNLRERGPEVEAERKQVEALGLRYMSIPVGGWSPPTMKQVARFLKLLRSSSGEKIFVHCHRGRDRTGVMIAAWRIAERHWTARQAIREMKSAGFRSLVQPRMWAFVKRFPEGLASDSLFLPFHQVPVPAGSSK